MRGVYTSVNDIRKRVFAEVAHAAQSSYGEMLKQPEKA